MHAPSVRPGEPTCFLDAATVTDLFDVELAVESQRDALRAIGADGTVVGKVMKPVGVDSLAFCYLARQSVTSPSVVKIGSVVSANVARGLPAVFSTIAVMDADTGALTAILDASPITTMRTAAASAVVAERLAAGPSTRVAVIGSGVQAKAHARVLDAVLRPREIALWSRRAAGCSAAVAALESDVGVRARVRAASSAEDAVSGCSIVVTCTASKHPVVRSDWLAGGTVVISIGSYEPDRCEVGDDVLRRASAVIVDDIESALAYAGPIRAALAGGIVTASDLIAIGDVFRETQAVPQSLFYNSTGVGIQDACAAERVVALARERGLGVRLRT
jgi:ornithine cyclodeaminase/alanine dehydrogenase-like protein (mu-crystallin family)